MFTLFATETGAKQPSVYTDIALAEALRIYEAGVGWCMARATVGNSLAPPARFAMREGSIWYEPY
jgi:hypothetical protein